MEIKNAAKEPLVLKPVTVKRLKVERAADEKAKPRSSLWYKCVQRY